MCYIYCNYLKYFNFYNMAAEFKTEIWTTVSSLKIDLLEGLDILKKRRKILEKQCGRCEELFKRWPQNISQTYRTGKNNVEKNTEQLEQETVNKPNSKDEKEKQELAMLDDILAKAQYARDINTKLSKSSKRPKSSASTGTQVLQNVHAPSMKEAKTKPKITYPKSVNIPPANTTYSAAYKKAKQLVPGSKRTSGSTSQSLPLLKPLCKEKLAECLPHALSTQQSSSSAASKENTKNPSDDKACCETLQDSINNSSELKFCLSEKGSLLKMPVLFLNLSKNHRKLFRKVREINVDSFEDSGLHFAEQVEEMFYPIIRGRSSGKVTKRCFHDFVKDYEELLDLTRLSVSTLQSIMESTCVEIMSEGCKTWEFVASKYETLNHELYSLTEALDSLCCPCPEYNPSSVITCCSRDAESNLTSSLSGIATTHNIWLSTNDDGFFTYGNPKELKTLQKLSHDYEIMKYEIEVRRIIGNKILPLLRQLPTNHRLFIPLFRSVYSILCCNGRAYPTMIKDISPDDEAIS